MQPTGREHLRFIAGPVGSLEAMIQCPPHVNTVGIVCHPHPLQGGTMNNKVVTTVAKVFHNLGFASVRFNYRGVGQSEGSYAEGMGETDDLLAIMQWSQQEFPDSNIVLAGFSFGGYVALRAADKQPVSRLILIAPAIHRFAMSTVPNVHYPWILIQGDQDEVVPAEPVLSWAKSQTIQPNLILMPGVGHFFHGNLLTLRDQLQQALK